LVYSGGWDRSVLTGSLALTLEV